MAEQSVTDCVEIESDFLHFLLSAKTSQSQLLLRNVTISQVDAISEICANIIHGTEVVDNPELLQELKPHKNLIRKLADEKSRVSEKRLIINKHPLSVLKIIQRIESLLP
jgi:hypothetical protein